MTTKRPLDRFCRFFAQLTTVTDRQTDHATRFVGRIYVRSTAMDATSAAGSILKFLITQHCLKVFKYRFNTWHSQVFEYLALNTVQVFK